MALFRSKKASAGGPAAGEKERKSGLRRLMSARRSAKKGAKGTKVTKVKKVAKSKKKSEKSEKSKGTEEKETKEESHWPPTAPDTATADEFTAAAADLAADLVATTPEAKVAQEEEEEAAPAAAEREEAPAPETEEPVEEAAEEAEEAAREEEEVAPEEPAAAAAEPAEREEEEEAQEEEVAAAEVPDAEADAPAEAPPEAVPAADSAAPDLDEAAPFPEEGLPTQDEETDADASRATDAVDGGPSYDELITEPSIEAVEQNDTVLLGFYQPVPATEDNPTASTSFQSLLDDAGAGLQGLLDGAMDVMSCGGLPAFGAPAVPEEGEEEASRGSGPEVSTYEGESKKILGLNEDRAKMEPRAFEEEERNDCSDGAPALAEVETRQ